MDPTAGLKDTDRQLMEMLDQQALSYQVILTKRDKLSKEAFNRSSRDIEQYLVKHAICCYPELLITGKRRTSKINDNDDITQEMTRVKWAVVQATGITVRPSLKQTGVVFNNRR